LSHPPQTYAAPCTRRFHPLQQFFGPFSFTRTFFFTRVALPFSPPFAFPSTLLFIVSINVNPFTIPSLCLSPFPLHQPFLLEPSASAPVFESRFPNFGLLFEEYCPSVDAPGRFYCLVLCFSPAEPFKFPVLLRSGR